MTSPGGPADPAVPESGRMRLLALLVAAQGGLMVVVGLAFLGFVLTEGDNSGYAKPSDALSGALVLLATLTIWGVALALTARAARQGRRWSFSVILFTQMMWGLIFVSSIRTSGGVYLVVLVVLLAWVIAILALLFHPDVRYRLGRGPAPTPR
jgi:hypothetical protein